MRELKNILWTAILVILLQSACNGPKQDKLPPNLIGEEQMREVLTDVLIAESYTQMHRMTLDSGRDVSQKYYAEIFARHHVSAKQFYSSMTYYLKHPDIMEENFQPIIDSLSSIEAKVHQ